MKEIRASVKLNLPVGVPPALPTRLRKLQQGCEKSGGKKTLFPAFCHSGKTIRSIIDDLFKASKESGHSRKGFAFLVLFMEVFIGHRKLSAVLLVTIHVARPLRCPTDATGHT